MTTLKLIAIAGFYAMQFLLTYTKTLIDQIFPSQKIKIILALFLYIFLITTLNMPPNKNPTPLRKTEELHKIEFKFPPPPQLPAFVSAPAPR
ncbi:MULTISPECIES: hypothetical protein [Pseudomonas chlororaphis group]|uniref:hypothetical protein n=1 Tax=Pseudomonas chlororaphis group TaxID=136842 RepID=UPI0020983EB2|nr:MULTISPECIES: hypothetical protein [Pseudomonas chlororaphis group]MCO7577816.1 hypothetical protein [Pseudomonas protegens]MCO7584191.1 hypothetical protein [Pseudomonas chlororaphis]MCO7601199.1 hypothetical protein [Pseudomonas chlororaphis]